MTTRSSTEWSDIWRARQWLSRVALVVAAVLLVIGLGLGLGLGLALGGHAAARAVLGVACALLVTIPTLNVMAVFAVEIRRRDWRFVAATGIVILLLAYSVVTKVLMRQ